LRAYSERVWQGYVGHDALVDVGVTWRISPLVSEGRASRTAVTMKVSTPSFYLTRSLSSPYCNYANKTQDPI